jgi:DHA2 family multidrug resistance protein
MRGAAPAASAAAPAQFDAEPRFDVPRLVAFLSMVFGMFMAILDVQIVSASLSEIQAGLAASADEVAWVQTSYLVAEVVMIPLSGLLSRLMSTRYLFVVSAAGFTLMSFMCAQATDINEMIVYRAAQGFIGGAMIPTVFASAYTIFPRNKVAVVTPLIGLVATLAPTIGPTVGGYLTDLLSWHWLFMINIVPGIAVTLAAWFLIDFDRPNWKLLPHFDFAGLAGMAAFLGALEYMLEEGPNKSWFEEDAIVWAALISVTGAAVFFWRAFTAKQPVVDLSAFTNRNFWTGSLFSFVMGVGLYGLTYIYPVYLARVRGYSALQIGETMFLSGLCMFVAAPIVGRLATKFDLRLLIGLGFSGFALGTWLATNLTKDWAFDELLLPQILRGFSLMLCMIPINNLALGTLPPERIKNASGLFNLTRNLGGAVGLALINTVMNNRMDLHLQRLHDSVAWGRQPAEDALAGLTAAMASRGSDAELAAVAKLAALVRGEALVMALADVFFVLSLLFLATLLVLPLMRRAATTGAIAGH